MFVHLYIFRKAKTAVNEDFIVCLSALHLEDELTRKVTGKFQKSPKNVRLVFTGKIRLTGLIINRDNSHTDNIYHVYIISDGKNIREF